MTAASPLPEFTFITPDDRAVVERIPFEGASGPVIRFHNQRDFPWGCLSNFYPAPIIVAGKSYPTSEHFFQSLKFFGKSPELMETIRTTDDPGVAAEMGRDREHPIRADWEQVKEDIMFHALVAKYSQHPLLLYALMQTKYTMIVEWHHKDKYWASGSDFLEGQNRLGILLMQVREQFRNASDGLLLESENMLAANAKRSAEPQSCPDLPPKLEATRQRVAKIIATTKERPFVPGKYEGKPSAIRGVLMHSADAEKFFKADGTVVGVLSSEKQFY